MLTQRQLTLIRAALKFFDEEIGPHGQDAAKGYFDEPLESGLAAREVRQLRELLRRVELRYFCCEGTGMTVPRQELLTFQQTQRIRNLPNGRLATVLLTSHP